LVVSLSFTGALIVKDSSMGEGRRMGAILREIVQE
jgi:hypothetical protein